MLKNFDYYAPTDLKTVLDILQDGNQDIHMIAGGTDLIISMNEGRVSPDVIVNLKSVKELTYVKEEDGIIRIGAATSFNEIANSMLINKEARVLAQACRSVGSTQIRNLGTIGGNIVNASPAADSVTALLVLDAEVVIQSAKGERTEKIVDIYLPTGGIELAKEEVLTEINFKASKGNTFSYFVKFGLREALTIVEISAAAVIEIGKDHICTDAKVSIGAIQRHPLRAKCVENEFIGKELNSETIEKCIGSMSEFTAATLLETPFKDLIPYKKQCIKGVAREVFEGIYNKSIAELV